MNYKIESSSGNQTVKMWSTKRLPFEPKGWLKDMREDIKKELKILKQGTLMRFYMVLTKHQQMKPDMILKISYSTMLA